MIVPSLPETHLRALWHHFAAEHAIAGDTLTYATYAAHAATFGPWLMQTLTTNAPVAHLVWEMVWSSLTAQPWRSLKTDIVFALVEAGARVWWAMPFTAEASGFEALYVGAGGILDALQIGDAEDREEAARRLNDGVVPFNSIDQQTRVGMRVAVPEAGREYYCGVKFQDLVGHVAIFSGLPACQAYTAWYCRAAALREEDMMPTTLKRSMR